MKIDNRLLDIMSSSSEMPADSARRHDDHQCQSELDSTDRVWRDRVTLVERHLGISRRLAEVAVLAHQLFGEKQIATLLGLPRNTVHARMRRLYATKGVNGITDLVVRVERILAAQPSRIPPHNGSDAAAMLDVTERPAHAPKEAYCVRCQAPQN